GHDIGGIANSMALRPEVRLAVAARVGQILPVEGAQAGARPKVGYGFRGKSKRTELLAQRHVEDEVLAVLQPFRIATHGRPGAFAEGDRPAGGQKRRRVYIIHRWQDRGPHDDFEISKWISLEPAADDLDGFIGKRGDDLFQPVG